MSEVKACGTRPSRKKKILTSSLLRMAVVGLVSATLISLGSSSAMSAVRDPRLAQLSFAATTVGMPYQQFLTRKAEFERAGCRADRSNYSQPGCTRQKPSPLNAFDWTDDGCSGKDEIKFVSLYYRDMFNGPCQLHDFGYRNFGKGLRLSPYESTRLQIDNIFYTEMKRLCDDRFSGWRGAIARADCKFRAENVYLGVRRFADKFS